jgi:large conductance mechanosensitive channel
MAVGIIVGGAFGTIVKSLVSDVLMPPIGLMLGGVDFSDLFLTIKTGTVPGPYPSLKVAQTANAVTINYGLFINAVISFLIVSFSVFILIKILNSMRRSQEAPAAAPATKECPFCASAISLKATRCPHCTSEIR